MSDKELWGIAQKQAIKEYEEECGPWEYANKYERENWVFGIYMDLKEQFKDEIEKQNSMKYKVIIHYEGALSFEIEAKNEDEAKEIAEMEFADCTNEELAANLESSDVCDCWEI